MTLHENKTLFRQAIQATADQLSMAAIYIEKDYWVIYALHAIFHHKIGKEVVFKGGTALSKCYEMIERFSEDIDLVVSRKADESNNQLSNKIKIISKVVSEVLPEVQIEGITQKRGMNRKTAHRFEKIFSGNYGQVRPDIIVEATWLGYFEPFTTKPVISFVGKMMLANSQKEMARSYGLMPFDLQVLRPERTICEKIMSLVRFSYTENPIADLKLKLRHIYDLHQLLQQKEFSDFFDSQEFETMLLKVANDDVKSYKNSNQWLVNHPGKAIIFNDLESVWRELNGSYNTEFRNMVYGKLPADLDIFETLNKIRKRLSGILWSI